MITIVLVVGGFLLLGGLVLFVVRGNSPAGRGKSGAAAARGVSDAGQSTVDPRGPGLN